MHKISSASRLGAVLASALFATACAGTQPTAAPTGAPTAAPPSSSAAPTTSAAPSGGGSLTIGVYGGGWDVDLTDAVVTPFQQETGITVTLTAGDDASFFSKLRIAGGDNPPVDVTITQPRNELTGVPEGLFLPIDTSRVSNWSQLAPKLYEPDTIDGQVYGVPFSCGQVGYHYRTDKVTTPPSSWLDLWGPAYVGHVALPALTLPSGLEFFTALVHTLGGEMSNPDDIDAAFNKLAELAPSVVATPASLGDIENLISSGDAWISPNYDGRVFNLQANGAENIGFVYPEEGAVLSCARFAIAAGTQKTDLVYPFLEALIDPDHQKVFGDRRFYAMSNPSTDYSSDFRAKVKADPEHLASLLNPDFAAAAANIEAWQARWDEIIGAR